MNKIVLTGFQNCSFTDKNGKDVKFIKVFLLSSLSEPHGVGYSVLSNRFSGKSYFTTTLSPDQLSSFVGSPVVCSFDAFGRLTSLTLSDD